MRIIIELEGDQKTELYRGGAASGESGSPAAMASPPIDAGIASALTTAAPDGAAADPAAASMSSGATGAQGGITESPPINAGPYRASGTEMDSSDASAPAESRAAAVASGTAMDGGSAPVHGIAEETTESSAAMETAPIYREFDRSQAVSAGAFSPPE